MTRRAQVAEITGRSMSVARSLLARARQAGWIESHGRTSGTYDTASLRLTNLGLRSRSVLRGPY
jgi:hypothetical protein